MDKYVSGFISGFERRYSRLERVIKHTLTRTVLQSPRAQEEGGRGGRASGGGEAAESGGAQAAQGCVRR